MDPAAEPRYKNKTLKKKGNLRAAALNAKSWGATYWGSNSKIKEIKNRPPRPKILSCFSKITER